MAAAELKLKIDQSIQAFSKGSLTANALHLFQTLGYNTERQAPLDKPTYNSFKESWIDNQSKFNETKAIVTEWKYVDLLFQLSKEEVLKQTSLFTTKQVDRTAIETYLFFTIELTNKISGDHYSRTKLAQITREVNLLFAMPAMILFKHGNLLTLSVINRRLHKRDDSKDVLEKVTLIKDIQIQNPHRAHIEILFDLSFDELKNKYGLTNFVELHNAWQKTLDTKELNKRFFQELANWYFYAQGYVQFPNDEKIEEKRNVQSNLIRLITRLIFVWFLKEKNLIEDNLFDKIFLKKILKGFDPDGEKTKNYHSAILQNLFFATLNQKMNERSFIVEGSFFENKEQYGVKTLYRYAPLFNIPENEIVKIFKDIPFLNGGLFDCLDKENEETGKVEYVDGFSRNPKKVPVIPDFLFFGKERIVDLTASYGFKKNKEPFRGLIEIFENYKFTIEENTPVEEEIALDPELLGKVFENLLAYYNPETETTARKQTGSFYTPREIVNYMVDESLIAYLKTQLISTSPSYVEFGKVQMQLFGNEVSKGQLSFTESINESRWTGKEDELEEALRRLIHYNDEQCPFNEQEIQQLIFAIDHCKILDPACGSGAFPMGVLHKLVYVLGKLDPDNIRWRELQKLKAIRDTEQTFNIGDVKQREGRLKEINETFENNASDFGRKLYLIENCIYGVDIQAIAVQISKLRFFISLVVDQKEKQGADNRGIRPLPNLETKFVAANTLIGLDKPKQLKIVPTELTSLEKQLEQVRHQHFEAKSRKEKLKCQKQDNDIRKKIATLLKDSGWHSEDADKISRFDLYDQNTAAGWFEPEWMFGKDLEQGFDIVIGNPPYVDSETMTKNNPGFRDELKERYQTAKGNWDLFVVFTEKGMKLTAHKGCLSFIIPNKIISAKYTYDLRSFLSKKSIIEIVDYSYVDVFKEADVYPVVLIALNDSTHSNSVRSKVMIDLLEKKNQNVIISELFYKDIFWDKFFFNPEVVDLIIKITSNEKLENKFPKLFGAATVNEAYQVKEAISELSDQKKYLKFINTGTIDAYKSLWGIKSTQYIKSSYQKPVIRESSLNKINATRYYQSISPKIIIAGMALYIEAFYDYGEYYAGKSTAIILGESIKLKALTGILNSKLVSFWFAKYFNSLSMAGGYFNIGTNELNQIPLPSVNDKNERILVALVELIIFLKKDDVSIEFSTFFKRLIDAIAYELYLEEEVKAAGCEVLKHLTDLPELKEDWSDEKKLQTIEKVYDKLSNPNHPVSVAMFKMDTIEEIRIIEGKQ